MRVNLDACVGCGSCVPYCPMRALTVQNGHADVDRGACVECGACVRNGCPLGALEFEELPWPRVIRRFFSDPNFSHSTTTKGMGRGTAEMKTNDVTGRYPRGKAGIGIEMGRPSTGVGFDDIEMVTRRLAELGIAFEEKNPLTTLMADRKRGIFKEEVKGERLLSAIVEFSVDTNQLSQAMELVKEFDEKISTVFSVFLCSRVEEDGSIPNVEEVQRLGHWVSPNAKCNVGLGRPLFRETDTPVTESAGC